MARKDSLVLLLALLSVLLLGKRKNCLRVGRRHLPPFVSNCLRTRPFLANKRFSAYVALANMCYFSCFVVRRRGILLFPLRISLLTSMQEFCCIPSTMLCTILRYSRTMSIPGRITRAQGPGQHSKVPLEVVLRTV